MNEHNEKLPERHPDKPMDVKPQLWSQSALELTDLFVSMQVSPVEVALSVLDRIDELNSLLGAYITVTRSVALDGAHAAERRLREGERLSRLDGIPYSIKDMEPTAGIRTTFGSPFFKDYIPAEDSTLVARMRASGAVLLGKTNTCHFGYKDMTDSLVAPTAFNPWMLSRTPGGSSGGAAAAVATGMGPLALGSDGGGSIRIPASLCGVYGIKPTFGLVPRVPSPDAWEAMATAGPIARTVRDAAVMLTVIAGPDYRDPWSSLPKSDFVTSCDSDLSGLRIAWSPDLGGVSVEPSVRHATTQASAAFTELGARVDEIQLDWPEIRHAFDVIYESALAAQVYRSTAERGAQQIESSLQELVNRGSRWSVLDLRYAMMRRTEFFQSAAATLHEYDLLLTPTMPMTAWNADVDSMQGPEGRTVSNVFDRLPFTYPFNMTGMPAASIPCGFGPGRLPIGLQIIAARGRDDLVLRSSAAFESARPWASVWPAVHMNSQD